MKRVLFVDDEPQVLQGLRTSLYARRKEWDMHFAAGGAQAVELMRASHFDVPVTDLRMPSLNGTALVGVVEAVAQHEDPAPMAGPSPNAPNTIRVAHALLSVIRPSDLPPCEQSAPIMDNDELRGIGIPSSWESLLEQTGVLLDAQEAA